MKDIHPNYIQKSEDEDSYKRLAAEGMDLMYPVRIRGRSHRMDMNIPYHSTIKLFDTSKDKPEQVHEVASNLALNPPNPKEVHIEPTTLQGRTGYTMHVLKLHGPHAEGIKEHHKKFAHLGFQEKYDFSPHITVDKQTWDHVVNSKAKTAHEAGIEFMPAELHHKSKVVANYKPKIATDFGKEPQAKDKLEASEKLAIVRDTIGMHIDLKKHTKALSLSDIHLSNYLQDNPELEKSVLDKHEDRINHHFGDNEELAKIAWEKGLREAYKVKQGK